MAKDPVCNMTVDENKAAATSEYKGKVYYFCAVGCKESFEKEPEKFLEGSSEHEHSHS
jgi:YHS domain-containing protein